MKKIFQKNLKFKLISIKTKDLKRKQILSICKLKNSFWPWTIQKQFKWYKKTTKKTDINNMLIINSKLVGYTLLRKRKGYTNNQSFIYYYLDSFILHKTIRNKGFGEILILFNNKILNKLKKHSFLTCPKKTVPFYLKYKWKILSKNNFKIMDHKPTWFSRKSQIYGMSYNLGKKVSKKIFYYFN